jgi:hypothetical protein
MRFVRAIYLQLMAAALALSARAEVAAPLPTTFARPIPLVWDSVEKHVEMPAMTNLAHFTFWMTNTASENVVILAMEAECDCTVVEARKKLPWILQPGDDGAINVRVNTRGRFGLFTRPVTVHTSHGRQTLTVSMNIPLTPAPSNVSPRQQDVLIAMADRQAVFSGRCAPCHAFPALNQTGESLFEKACGICHTAKRRAEMVPDLAAATRERDAGYWRDWITYGKKGSLMPAFAKSEGGILDTNQIESLVQYLLAKYPSAMTESAPGNAINIPATQ